MPPANLTNPAVKSATRLSLINLVIAWIQYLNGQIGSTPTTVVNGGFQQYTGSNNTPDNWTFTAYNGGAGAIDVTTSIFGSQSFKISVPGGTGNGGGYIQSNVLVPFSSLEDFWCSWYYKSNVATIANQVDVLWYTAAGAYISTTNLWTASSGQPSSWTQNSGFVLSSNIPSGACFYALRFTGGSVNSTAGSVWYEDIKSGFRSIAFSGKSQLFTSSGTFTPPSNCFLIQVKMWGGGGGASELTGVGAAGGSYVEGFLNVTPGVAITITVGAGGAGSNSSTSATGGHSSTMTSGGVTLTAGGGGAVTSGSPGLIGSASGGYLNLPGQPGGSATGSISYAPANYTYGISGTPQVATPNSNGKSGAVLILY